MKPIYPYYEIKNAVDEFVLSYGDKMTNEKWSIESKTCKQCDDEFDSSIREVDDKFFFVTSNGSKKINKDYLFVSRSTNGKPKKHIYQHLSNAGFDINEKGLITNYKKNDEVSYNDESNHSCD